MLTFADTHKGKWEKGEVIMCRNDRSFWSERQLYNVPIQNCLHNGCTMGTLSSLKECLYTNTDMKIKEIPSYISMYNV